MSKAATDYLKSRANETVRGHYDHQHFVDIEIAHLKIDQITKPRVKVVVRDGVTIYINRWGTEYEV